MLYKEKLKEVFDKHILDKVLIGVFGSFIT
jgi:hypothetical protein